MVYVVNAFVWKRGVVSVEKLQVQQCEHVSHDVFLLGTSVEQMISYDGRRGRLLRAATM